MARLPRALHVHAPRARERVEERRRNEEWKGERRVALCPRYMPSYLPLFINLAADRTIRARDHCPRARPSRTRALGLSDFRPFAFRIYTGALPFHQCNVWTVFSHLHRPSALLCSISLSLLYSLPPSSSLFLSVTYLGCKKKEKIVRMEDIVIARIYVRCCRNFFVLLLRAGK